MDKHSIKYPIEDNLIKKMPVLHGADLLPAKPQPKAIMCESADFERLVYIWEFLNNFCDFMSLQPFRLEELQLALSFSEKQVQLYSQDPAAEDQDWEEQINNKTVAKQGFDLVNAIHIAVLDVFVSELKHKDEKLRAADGAAKEEEGDTLLDDIRKYVDKPELVWPEMLRLILKSQKNFDFFPLDERS